MNRRKTGLAIVAAALLLAGALRHPQADFQLLMHRSSDPAPGRMQAALDLGVMAVSVLVTRTRSSAPD